MVVLKEKRETVFVLSHDVYMLVTVERQAGCGLLPEEVVCMFSKVNGISSFSTQMYNDE